MNDLLPFLREFGFPVALCLVLLWAIRSQNTQLVKAYTDRIGTLELLVHDLSMKVDDLERDRIRRADEYGTTIRSMALSWASATKETNEVVKSSLSVQRKICDFIATMAQRIPGVSFPSTNEVPRDPITERLPKQT